MTETKQRLDAIGQLNNSLNTIELQLSQLAYVQRVLNSVTGIVFDKKEPVVFDLPVDIIQKITDVIDVYLTSERDSIIEKASDLLK